MANMVKLLQFPNINYDLSWHAYKKRKDEYNASVNRDSRLRLKDVHDKMFEILINDLHDWQKRKNEHFPDNTILNQALRGELPKLCFTRISVGKLIDRHPRTIRERLRRLERAGIISVGFHGSKKPLQIQFNPEIAILFDAKDKNFLPVSDYFNETQAKISLEKFFNRKPSEPTSYEEYPTKHNTSNVSPVQYKFNNITITENGVLHSQNFDYYLNNNTEGNNIPINNTDTSETKGSNRYCPDLEQKKEKSSVKKEKKDISRNENVRLQTIWTYAMLFYAYIVENLFADKKSEITDWYKAETIQYIAQNYFSKANSGEMVVRLWEFLYKPRIDLAKKEIEKFPLKYKREFNRDKFYPRAYLDITKKGKLHYSFANTFEFIKKQKEWNSLNFWNRKLNDNEVAYKFYRIIRDVENQKIDYETAIEKVRSINMDTNIFTMMLNASFTGNMFDAYVKKAN